MSQEPHDIDEKAASMRAFVDGVARAANPERVYLTVVDETMRYQSGYVLCDLEGRIVRCEVALPIDTAVDVVLIATPPRYGSASDNYYCIGAYGGGDNYVSGVVGSGINVVGNSGAKTSANINTSDNDVSNPPTDAEIDLAFNAPVIAGDGFIGVIDDDGAGANVWLCVSDGANWWYVALTKAT